MCGDSRQYHIKSEHDARSLFDASRQSSVKKTSLNIALAGPLNVDLRASLGVTSKSWRVIASDVERALKPRRRRRRLLRLDDQQVRSNARPTRVGGDGAVRGRRGVAESPT